MSGSSQRERPRHSAGLLLRVHRPGGEHEEFYLAPGLTIGRTVANAIVLADEPAVDRTHARVEIGDDGWARLVCIEPDSSLDVAGTPVRELPLDAGTQFQIGRTRFECIPGQGGADRPRPPARTACPLCGSADVGTEGGGARLCPDCNEPVLPVRIDAQDSRPLLVPALYGTYHAERTVARGGMGLVFQGSLKDGGEAVAIKVLLPGQLADQHDSDRFEREVAMMTRVEHPNVVKLLDHGRSGRFHYLVLEWIEGPTLGQAIPDARLGGKPASFDTAFRWFEQVCDGLRAIHAVGMVHRDIKPSNILIGPDNVARIADFGIAKRIDSGSTSFTTTGHAPGTFVYMAPEQFSAPDTVDARADLYALGVTFYESLTGELPVGAWEPASKLNRNVPRAFDKILKRLLERRPLDRYRDSHGLQSAIHTFRRNREIRTAAYIGARNGAIWGVTVLGMLDVIIGFPLSCCGALVTEDGSPLVTLLTSFAWIAVLTATGTVFSGLAGAFLAADRASEGDLGQIRPIGFRDVLVQTLAAVQRLCESLKSEWIEFRHAKDRAILPGKLRGAAAEVEIASRPTKDKLFATILTRNPEIMAAAYIGARSGAMWGLTLIGLLFGTTALSLCFIISIVESDALPLLAGSLYVTLVMIAGAVMCGLMGAIRGYIAATDGDSSKIAPVSFRKIRTQIWSWNAEQIHNTWRSLGGWRMPGTPPRRSPDAPSKSNVSSEPKKNYWFQSIVVSFIAAMIWSSIRQAHRPASVAAGGSPITPWNPTAVSPGPRGISAEPSLLNSLGMKLILIPAGEFMMGSFLDNYAAGDEPAHRVRITQPFYMGVYEVTQEQFETVMGRNPSYFSAAGVGEHELAGRDTRRHPVENASWNDAIEFCNRLSEWEGLRPYYRFGVGEQSGGDGYRLPTESEWEYACRAGSDSWYNFGDDAARLPEYAWFTQVSTHPVGQKLPNAWGLYDMHGNVWEWCWDGYDKDYYQQSPDSDPPGPSQVVARVIRGGCWHDNPRFCRSANRGSGPPYRETSIVGFRVARVLSGQ